MSKRGDTWPWASLEIILTLDILVKVTWINGTTSFLPPTHKPLKHYITFVVRAISKEYR